MWSNREEVEAASELDVEALYQEPEELPGNLHAALSCICEEATIEECHGWIDLTSDRRFFLIGYFKTSAGAHD